MTIFERVREQLDDMVPVARYYGYTPNRAGYIPCPFHPDKTASLKLYSGGRGWYCFGCKKGGTVIDFAARLLNLSPLEAVKRLKTDFHLGLDLEYKEPTPQERRELQRRREVNATFKFFEKWRSDMLQKLNSCLREAHLLLKGSPNLDRLTEAQSLAIREQAQLEYLADLLESEVMADMMPVFQQRKEVEQLCMMILSGTRTKSGAA